MSPNGLRQYAVCATSTRSGSTSTGCKDRRAAASAWAGDTLSRAPAPAKVSLNSAPP